MRTESTAPGQHFRIDPRKPEEPPLALNLFGPFLLRVRGQLVSGFRSQKSRRVLSFLALNRGREVERAWLAGLLWPDDPEATGLTNLRQILADVRRALGPEADRLDTPGRRCISFDLSGTAVDCIEFDSLIKRGDTEALARAVSLHTAPLLAGWTDDWVLEARREREETCLGALENLAAAARTRGDHGEAARWLRRAVELDPLRETAQRDLMRALAAGGSHSAAVMCYRDLRLRLHRELNASPDPETAALFEEIRSQSCRGVLSRHIPSIGGSPPPVRLPRPLTPFVGRAKELEDVAALVGRSRLLTLTGAGGVGKTRLAVEVARRIVEDFNDGAWFVDLASLAEGPLLIQAIAGVLGVREERERPLVELLVQHLESRHLLLLLDNCEHVAETAAPLVDTLLQAAAGLRILATSRQSLGIPGEVIWRVPSLSVSGDDPAASEAVELFIQRGSGALPSFTPAAVDSAVVAHICRRLDGIPLAIELAAARLSVLTVQQIAQRLDDRFRLLTGAGRGLPARQQTLRATMEWSYGLLTQPERRLLRLLSVFLGGWSLEAAEEVGESDEIPRADILDLLSSLVDKSLVSVEAPAGAARYRLLETTREFAAAELCASGEDDCVRDRHALYFRKLAEGSRSEEGLKSAKRGVWLDRMEQDRDNLRAALTWLLPSDRIRSGEEGLRLAAALCGFFRMRGPAEEGLRWVEIALSRSSGETPAHAIGLEAAALLAATTAGWSRSKELHLEATALFEKLGMKREASEALRELANTAVAQGNRLEAFGYAEGSLRLARGSGSEEQILRAEGTLTKLSIEGALEEKKQHLRSAFEQASAAGDPIRASGAVHGLGQIAVSQCDLPTARECFAETLCIHLELRDLEGTAWALNNLAEVALLAEEWDEAARLNRASLPLFVQIGNAEGVSECLRGLAQGLCGAGGGLESSVKAARLFGAQHAYRTARHFPVREQFQSDYQGFLVRTRKSLGDALYSQAFQEGAGMTIEQAVAEALTGSDSAQ